MFYLTLKDLQPQNRLVTSQLQLFNNIFLMKNKRLRGILNHFTDVLVLVKEVWAKRLNLSHRFTSAILNLCIEMKKIIIFVRIKEKL